ncbi:hypothetical protein [Chryseobacterium turcicum]|uniref:Uncharacterized protein n=1 Tax=Chryseobacterium turcicum TaxID=2898076 RepID=A0A9Q3YYF5_9FLAO|nr:hypothetical protein [Chryseobacterium turcicum]MCD1116400.1 hypothetical protein [Chryseobacterium turcicum]
MLTFLRTDSIAALLERSSSILLAEPSRSQQNKKREWKKDKQDVHQIEYASDGSKNDLTDVEKQLLLKELQKIMR